MSDSPTKDMFAQQCMEDLFQGEKGQAIKEYYDRVGRMPPKGWVPEPVQDRGEQTQLAEDQTARSVTFKKPLNTRALEEGLARSYKKSIEDERLTEERREQTVKGMFESAGSEADDALKKILKNLK